MIFRGIFVLCLFIYCIHTKERFYNEAGVILYESFHKEECGISYHHPPISVISGTCVQCKKLRFALLSHLERQELRLLSQNEGGWELQSTCRYYWLVIGRRVVNRSLVGWQVCRSSLGVGGVDARGVWVRWGQPGTGVNWSSPTFLHSVDMIWITSNLFSSHFVGK